MKHRITGKLSSEEKVKHTACSTILNAARFYHASDDGDSSLSGRGLGSGWVIETAVDERRMKSLRKSVGFGRHRVMHCVSRSGAWYFAMFVTDLGFHQHRVIVPLLGETISRMLSTVSDGQNLSLVVIPPDGGDGLTMFSDQLSKHAHTLLASVKPLPDSPFGLMDEIVEQGLELAGPGHLQGDGRVSRIDSLVVGVCMPPELLELAKKELMAQQHH